MTARISAADLRPALAAASADIARLLLGQPNREFSTQSELRFGQNGSLAVVVSGPKAGMWRDHSRATGGDIFKLIQQQKGLTFPEAIEFGAAFFGACPELHKNAPRAAAQHQVGAEDAGRRKALAGQIWAAAKPFSNSLGETYLRNRLAYLQTAIPPRIDEALRFHPGVHFRSEVHPAMVAAVTDIHTDELLGVHLTAIDEAGSAIKRAGKTLRRIRGIKKGGAIKLTPDDEVHRAILVGEGIETVLSAMAITDFHGWALIDAGNLKDFPVLQGIETLAIAVDADDAGRDAAHTLTGRWSQAHREVFQIEPVEAGTDLNDIIRSAANAY